MTQQQQQHSLPLSAKIRPHPSSTSYFPFSTTSSAANHDTSSSLSPVCAGQKRHLQDPFIDTDDALVQDQDLKASSSQRNVPVFLNKLFSMVNDPSTDDMIHWSNDGRSFIIQGREEFAKVVLPRFYKHNTFASFVRQLNMYHFHKIPHIRQGALFSDSKHEVWEFSNPRFQRDRPGLLSVVARKRNRARDPEPQVDLTNVVEDIQDIRRNQASISSELHNLRQDNRVLWDETFAAREKYQEHEEVIGKILQFLTVAFSKNDSNSNVSAIAGAPAQAANLIKEATALANGDQPGEPCSLPATVKNTAGTGSSTSCTPGTASPSSSASSSFFPASYSASPFVETFAPISAATVTGPTVTIDMASRSAKAISDDIDNLQSTVEALASDFGIDPSHMSMPAAQSNAWAQQYHSFAHYHPPGLIQDNLNPSFEVTPPKEHENHHHGDGINHAPPLVARRASSNRVPSPVLRTSMNASFDTGRVLAPSDVPIPLSVPMVAPQPSPRSNYLSLMQAYANNDSIHSSSNINDKWPSVISNNSKHDM